MDLMYFKPTEGTDHVWYLRVVQPSKGVLGQLIEKAGFLKFLTQDEADEAFDTLTGGAEGIEVVFGAKQPKSEIYNISVVAVGVEEAAQ